ncbi:MAG: PilZ domain-containing protein [Acidobacteriota bacterium]
MVTVLLLDDDILFKAVEGSCLRRERCRLVKAASGDLVRVAGERAADLIVVSSLVGRELLRRLLVDPAVFTTPIIVIDFGPGEEGASAFVRDVEAGAGRGGIDVLVVPVDSRGRLDFHGLDAPFDRVVKRHLKEMDHRPDRITVGVSVRCRGPGVPRTLRTKNISPSGLFLKTDQGFDRGCQFDIRFILPGEATAEASPGQRSPKRSRGATITARCEVVRSVVHDAGADSEVDLIAGVGVRFVAMHDEQRAALQRFIRRSERRVSRAAVAMQ